MVLPPKNSMGQAVTEGIQIQAEDPICHWRNVKEFVAIFSLPQ